MLRATEPLAGGLLSLDYQLVGLPGGKEAVMMSEAQVRNTIVLRIASAVLEGTQCA